MPADDDPQNRHAKDICPEEIANAAAQILALHISMSMEDLVRETANVFGIRRIGSGVRSSFEDGIVLLKKRGGCREDGANLIVL